MCPARDDSFVEHTEYCSWLRGRLPNWQSWEELEDISPSQFWSFISELPEWEGRGAGSCPEDDEETVDKAQTEFDPECSLHFTMPDSH